MYHLTFHGSAKYILEGCRGSHMPRENVWGSKHTERGMVRERDMQIPGNPLRTGQSRNVNNCLG